MKFVLLHVEGCFVIGIEHEFGRVERLLVSPDDSGPAAAACRRAVDSLNACSELSDGTLATMAKGGTRFGSLAERVALGALLWGENPRLADRLLDQARREIKKCGGKI